MATYLQADRPLAITTPLGEDALLLTAVRGYEAISALFHFQLELLAELDSEVPFERILGQSVTVTLRVAKGEHRYLNGIIKRFAQGARDERFVRFRAELVPKLWLLTKTARSRIFQRLSTPDILQRVLSGLDVSYELASTYYARDYCVQYRESDFNFASRLMEEEGIYYYFQHRDGSHRMVVTDMPHRHPSVPGPSSVIYDEELGGVRDDMRITAWEKSQELRSGACALRDHCFELPGQPLEAKAEILDSVLVGQVTHKLSVGGNDRLEVYEYPGGYAQRFDGVDGSGGTRPECLEHIFKDRDRAVRIRMEQEESASLEIHGAGDCANFVAGHKFSLERHFDADGDYLLTSVEHDARLEGTYRAGENLPFKYGNRFTCIPVTLPFRPPRTAPKPLISGAQTATVTGPAGQEIFCDPYGRIKVQFHWDREGKKDGDSSCWLRVAQVWAGKRWGAFFWPRVGHEVVVVFEEGDPDQPLIVGSVYNAENMPPYRLPAKSSLAGFKSASYRGAPFQNFNGIVFNDEKGNEHLAFHSERSMSFNSEYDKMQHAGRHRGERVSSACMLTVGNLPLGGGSGGGHFDDDSAPMPHPKPLAILGLNSQWTYGENLQVAFGLNNQLAFGSNLQICVSPVGGLGAGDPGTWLAPYEAGLIGSGPGGNMQLTFGTSASFVLGQSFQINLGPTPINVTAKDTDHPITQYLCGLLYVVVAAWGILYGLFDGPSDDVKRAASAMVCQALLDALLVGIMLAEMGYKKADTEIDKALRPLFRLDYPEKEPDEQTIAQFVTENAVLLAIAAAPMAATLAESL